MKSSAAKKDWDHLNKESYDTNLITGALLWPDMKRLASLLAAGKSAAEVRGLVSQDNLLERKSTKRSLNVTSYLLQRLSLAPQLLLEIIANADSISSRQAALLVSLQNSRFLREFLTTVICDRLESFNTNLPPLYWEDFWASCLSKDHCLQSLRPKAVTELRSVLIKFLVDVGILDSSRSRALVQIRLTPQVTQVLRTSELSWLLPCIKSFVR